MVAQKRPEVASFGNLWLPQVTLGYLKLPILAALGCLKMLILAALSCLKLPKSGCLNVAIIGL